MRLFDSRSPGVILCVDLARGKPTTARDQYTLTTMTIQSHLLCSGFAGGITNATTKSNEGRTPLPMPTLYADAVKTVKESLAQRSDCRVCIAR